MSGLGRRTHYRKHLTDSVLYDYPEPASNECIAKIIATRGSNQFDIQLAKSCRDTQNNSDDNDSDIKRYDYSTGSKSDGSELAILPTKFRKLIWLKRNDFVIVQYATDDTIDDSKQNEKSKTKESSALPSDDDVDIPCGTVSGDTDMGSTLIVQSDSNSIGGGGIRYMITHILYKNQIQHLVTADLWPTHDPNFHTTSTTNCDATKMDSDGIVFTAPQLKSLNAVKEMITENGGYVAVDFEDAVNYMLNGR